MIASQYFLLCKHSNIVFMQDCHIEGDIFNPITSFGTDKMCYQNKEVYHSISLSFLIALWSEMHLLNLVMKVPHI